MPIVNEVEIMANILLVDDAQFMRMLLRGILEKAGHTICGEAKNGAEAFDEYKELHPDLVLLDITMPEVDGITALKNIKAYDENVKAIMCSAMGQQVLVIESIQAGAKDFIVKPFQADRVIEAINKTL